MLSKCLEQIKIAESHLKDINEIIKRKGGIDKITDEEVYIISYMLFNVINECLMICKDILKEKSWNSSSQVSGFMDIINVIFEKGKISPELYPDIRFLVKYRNNLKIILFTRNLGREALKEAYGRLSSLSAFLKALEKILSEE